MAKGSIWAKIGGAVKTGAKVTKNVLFLVHKASFYPIRKPFASVDEMKHDVKVSLKEAVDMNVSEEEKKYDPPIKTTQASKDFGVRITEQGKGEVTFLASKILTGDISHLSQKQLEKLKEDLPNVTIFRGENEIVIEVDVKEITNNIKNDPKHKGKSPEEIKKLVIERIEQKVDGDLKKFAKVTGGEFEVHTDRKLLYGIAEKLYREYDNQNKSSETAVSDHKKQKASEEEFNITNPNEFPYSKKAISKETMLPLTKIPQGIEKQVKELGRSAFLNLGDVSGEVIKSPSIPDKNKGKGGRSS